METTNHIINNTDFSSLINKLTNNPEDLAKIFEESVDQITPEMMDQAKKLALGGNGKKIFQEMQKKGLNPRDIKDQLLHQQKFIKEISAQNNVSTKQVIHINNRRILKIKQIPISAIRDNICKIIKCTGGLDPVVISCSRLAMKNLQNKTLKLWYNPHFNGSNKRASRISGFPIAGDIVIIMEEGDLTETDFLNAEKLLS